jgi:hypothetical protein
MYSGPIPQLPLSTVRRVQSLSACTVELYLYSRYRPYVLYRSSVHVQWSYTSIPFQDRTIYAEPQCLCSGAILLPTLLDSTVFTKHLCLYSGAINLLSL